MSRVFVHGVGAVSPAGWGAPALLAALTQDQPLPTQILTRPNGAAPLNYRPVPPPSPRPVCLGHPRLRRASAISQFAAAAATEALPPQDAPPRLGIVLGTHVGSIRYSERFYTEVLRDPTSASPLLFPETVLNAPTSHVAAFYPPAPLAATVIGDETAFLQALALGAHWLLEHRVEACLVVSAEETDWLVADALHHVHRAGSTSEGAGAVCLSLQPSAVELDSITSQHLYSRQHSRTQAALAMRRELGQTHGPVYDSCAGHAPSDRPENTAWADLPAPRISLRPTLGQAFAAASAWQCLAAWQALQPGRADTATVSVVGSNQAAIGARFRAVDPHPASPQP